MGVHAYANLMYNQHLLSIAVILDALKWLAPNIFKASTNQLFTSCFLFTILAWLKGIQLVTNTLASS